MALNQQVVILAGGLGTRLKPITEKIPKPIVEVGGKPYLHWQFLELKKLGFKKVLLLVAYLGHMIEERFKDGSQYGLEISYSYEPELLGTGGALKHAEAKLEQDFFLMNGDSFLIAPLAKMYDDYKMRNLKAIVSAFDNKLASPVPPNLRIENGLITEYKRAGQGFTFTDSGIYVISKDILAGAHDKKFQLEDLWPKLMGQKKLGAFVMSERFYDIGTPERLKEFEEKVRDYFKNTVST